MPTTVTTAPPSPLDACEDALFEPYLRWLMNGSGAEDLTELSAFGPPPPEVQSELIGRRSFWWSTMHSLHRIVSAFSDEDGEPWSDAARNDAMWLARDLVEDMCAGGIGGPPNPDKAPLVQGWVLGHAFSGDATESRAPVSQPGD